MAGSTRCGASCGEGGPSLLLLPPPRTACRKPGCRHVMLRMRSAMRSKTRPPSGGKRSPTARKPLHDGRGSTIWSTIWSTSSSERSPTTRGAPRVERSQPIWSTIWSTCGGTRGPTNRGPLPSQKRRGIRMTSWSTERQTGCPKTHGAPRVDNTQPTMWPIGLLLRWVPRRTGVAVGHFHGCRTPCWTFDDTKSEGMGLNVRASNPEGIPRVLLAVRCHERVIV